MRDLLPSVLQLLQHSADGDHWDLLSLRLVCLPWCKCVTSSMLVFATSNPEPDEVEDICSTFANVEHLQLHFPEMHCLPRGLDGLPALVKLRALRSLELSGAGRGVFSFTPEALVALSAATQLTKLRLLKWKLDDREPPPGVAALVTLKQLVVLHLEHCQLEAGPQLNRFLQALPRLANLSLHGNHRLRTGWLENNVNWRQLPMCAELTALDLGITKVRAEDIVPLGALTRLTRLDISGATMHEEGTGERVFQALQKLPRLAQLGMSYIRLDHSGPKALPTTLTALDACARCQLDSCADLVSDYCEMLRPLTGLTRLLARNCTSEQLFEGGLEQSVIMQVIGLRQLWLSRVQPAAFSVLGSLHELTQLWLLDLSYDSGVQLHHLQSLTCLADFNLAFCDSYDSVSDMPTPLKSLQFLRSWKFLTTLSLTHCDLAEDCLSSPDGACVLSQLPLLASLGLSWCHVQNIHVRSFAKPCHVDVTTDQLRVQQH